MRALCQHRLKARHDLFEVVDMLHHMANDNYVNLGVDQYGGISAEVLAQLGRFLNVRAKIVRVGTDTRYDTGFQVKIREGVYLEGKLKVLQAEEQTQSYEAKLKYRIPLDD